MKRYLAIDLGQKRTGLAVGDDELRLAMPFGVVVSGNPEQTLIQVGKTIEAEQPDAVVVGLPLNMDGSESAGSKRARDFAAALGERFGVEVHLMDERLTSAVADEQMAGRELTRDQKKMRRDALAAATILRDFLAGLATD